jgi:hypothetical protein
MSNLKCPKCQNLITQVYESRPKPGNEKQRRRRKCTNCANRFTTVEQIEYAVVDQPIDGMVNYEIVPWDYEQFTVYRGNLEECKAFVNNYFNIAQNKL